jgi:hypothetical protein
MSVVLFHSTSHAIKAERALKNASIACTMIPVPRHLSSDCGVCLRFSQEAKNAASDKLSDGKIQFEGPIDI